MIFDQQSNARRTAVESKSNRSCNHRVTYRLLTANAAVITATRLRLHDFRATSVSRRGVARRSHRSCVV